MMRSMLLIGGLLAAGGAAQEASRGRGNAGAPSAGAAGAVVSVKAQPRPAAAPAWSKGILPISPESYYNAIKCGKQGGADPPCVFWDTGLCKNDDFTLAMYTPYKQVAYEVWSAVKSNKPAPQPSYPAAQQARVTIGVTARSAKNPLTNLVVTRAGRAAVAIDRWLANGGGRYTFDFPVFAATGSMTLDLVGQERTVSCAIDQATLRTFR
jgi:hypothetical protein